MPAQVELIKIMATALTKAVEGLPQSANGLLVRCFPTESHLEQCVGAASQLLRANQQRRLRVVIGSSDSPASQQHPSLEVHSPDRAAALVTKLRNPGAPGEEETLIFICEADSPGASGVSADVFHILAPESVAGWYAEAAGLPLLQQIAASKVARIRRRLEGRSVEDLAAYALRAGVLHDDSLGQLVALPLLELVPRRLRSEASLRPTARWSDDWEGLDGIKLANKLGKAAEALGALTPEERDLADTRLREGHLPEEVCGSRRPYRVAIDLARAGAKLAEGDLSQQADLCGLSGNLLRLLRKGSAAAQALIGQEPEGEEEVEPAPPQSGPVREDLALDLLAGDIVSVAPDLAAIEVVTSEEPEDPTALTPSRRPAFIRALLSVAPRELWTEGGTASIRESDPFFRVESTVGVLVGPEFTALAGPPLDDGLAFPEVLAQFSRARRHLLQEVALLTQVQPGSTDEPSEPSEPGLVEAVTMLEAFPLLVARQLTEACEAYVKSYCDLIACTVANAQALPGHVIPWLANLDLAVLRSADTARARLLPTHPMMIERSLLHLRFGGAPPELPSTLAIYTGSRKRTLSPSVPGGLYAETIQARPSPEALGHAAALGLEVAWAFLQMVGMTRSLRVLLRGLSEPNVVAERLISRFVELADEDSQTDGVAHLELMWEEMEDRVGTPLSISQVSEELRGYSEIVPGEGVSVSLVEEAVSSGATVSHLLVDEAVGLLYYPPQQPSQLAPSPGARVSYKPGASGIVERISVDGSAAQSAVDDLVEVVTGSAPPAAKAPDEDHSTEGCLVRTIASKGGWPVDPTEAGGIATYDADPHGNFMVVLIDQDILVGRLTRVLQQSFPFLFQPGSGVSLSDLRRGALVLSDLRRTQLQLLQNSTGLERKLRGDLGKLKALLALQADGGPEQLIISLDGPEGHSLAGCYERRYGSKSRADLLVLEEGEDQPGRIRVIELKAYKSVPNTEEGRARLAEQALVSRSRLLRTFGLKEDPQVSCESIEGLRRLYWMGASQQRAAKRFQDLLESLDEDLYAGRVPIITAECWIIPDVPYDGPESFTEETSDLDPHHSPLDARIDVHYRIIPPLPPEEHKPELAAPGPEGDEQHTGQLKQEAASLPSEEPPTAPTKVGLTTKGAEAGKPALEMEASPEVSPEPQSDQGRLQLVLGCTQDRRPLVVSPGELENRNIMITGSSGKGKTQLVKSLLLQLREQECPVMVLDFKNDYASDGVLCSQARLEPAFVKWDGLPFNPLIPPVTLHPTTNQPSISVAHQVQSLAATLRSTYGLGPQQENRLKEAIREAYVRHDVPVRGTTAAREGQVYPTFQEIGEHLKELDAAAYGRLDPLFDMDLFREEFQRVGFDDLLKTASILDLSQLPSDQMKAALAKLFLISAHGYYNAEGHSGRARQFFIFDEAHRIMDEPKFEQFVRECRAYGVGVVVSSQNPSDFPGEVSASLAIKILHGNGAAEKRVRDIGRLVGVTSQSQRIGRLGLFDALTHNAKDGARFIKTLHYPAYLALETLGNHPQGSPIAAIEKTEGLDPDKIPALSLLHHLQEMGLAEERDSLWYKCPEQPPLH